MKKLLAIAAIIGVASILVACGKDKEPAAEPAQADVAQKTAEVAKEAEAAAQNTTATEPATAEPAEAINPDSAEAKVPEEQKY